MDIGYDAAQYFDEAVIFGDGSPEVRLLRVAQGFPLIPDIFPAEPGLAGVFEEEAPNRASFGAGVQGHGKSFFLPICREYIVFRSGLQNVADKRAGLKRGGEMIAPHPPN
jgi:hypothetical protein